MENRHFVALDAGSSKIALAVGYENEGKFSVTYYKAIPSVGINKGRIQNAQHAADAIQSLIKDAQDELELNIQRAVINYPNYPIEQHICTSGMNREKDDLVKKEDINLLMSIAKDEAMKKSEEMAKMSIYDCVPQSYSDGIDIQISEDDIEGRYCENIEGCFSVYLGKEFPVTLIDNTLGMSGLEPTRKFFTPNIVGKMVLDISDRENGVALVDIGGSVTSVSIFSGGVLRHFDSIPFGGRNVTMDIRNECGLSEALAENLKKAYGICCPDKLLSMSDKQLRIKLKDATRTKEVWVKYLSEIVTARMTEIFDAVLYIIEKSGFSDDLRSGIVLTGGGALLCNCGKLLEEMSGYTVRTGKLRRVFSNLPKECQQADAVNCMALLYAARTMDKINFVNDPNEPRISAIDTPRKNEEGDEEEEDIFHPKTVKPEKPNPARTEIRERFFGKGGKPNPPKEKPSDNENKKGISIEKIVKQLTSTDKDDEEEDTTPQKPTDDMWGNNKLF